MPSQQFKNRHNRTVSAAPVSRAHTDDAVAQIRRAKLALLGVAVLVVGIVFVNSSGAEAEPVKIPAVVQAAAQVEPVAAEKSKIVYGKFPEINETKLTPVQKRIVTLARSEYAKRPTGYDQSVMSYTEGAREPWCANFISWIRDEAGIPYEHPTTGYWRIPGVSTLRDYYRNYSAYLPADEYTPKLGDVAFYEGDTADENSSEHVALVLGVEGDKLITIGGNETKDSILQIRYSKFAVGERGLVAFGRTSVE